MRKFVILTVLIFGGCKDDPVGPRLPGRAQPLPAPLIRHPSVGPNPHNVLSADVYAEVQYGDSVAVRFRLADASEEITTPAIGASSVEGKAIPLHLSVFELLPASHYIMYVVVWGGGGTTWSHLMNFTTGELPSDLPRYTAGGSDPTAGYVVFRAGEYGLVIDNTGRVVWYRHFPGGSGLEFTATPSGSYVTWPKTPDPWDLEPWVEIDPSGGIRGAMRCDRGLAPRSHDLLVEPGGGWQGGYWILCDDVRSMDLTQVGGLSNAQVTGTAVHHVSFGVGWYDYCPCPDFHWSPFDHFQVTDIEAAERAGPIVDWTDGNSIDLAADGNIIVSFGNLNEITKINRLTGEVIWRLGGLRNEFRFIGTALPAFTSQHSVRVHGNELLLLDNLGDAGESRIERYALDEAARTARLTASFGAGPGVVSTLGGSVQRLPDGRILASFGNAGRVVEFDAAGNIVWSIDGNAGNVARAQRMTSLYTPGLGAER